MCVCKRETDPKGLEVRRNIKEPVDISCQSIQGHLKFLKWTFYKDEILERSWRKCLSLEDSTRFFLMTICHFHIFSDTAAYVQVDYCCKLY